MRAAIYTLGCKVNQYETQAMEQELRRRGHELVDFEDSADAYIINTCSVTAVSDKKSRQMIRRLRREHPEAVRRARRRSPGAVPAPWWPPAAAMSRPTPTRQRPWAST